MDIKDRYHFFEVEGQKFFFDGLKVAIYIENESMTINDSKDNIEPREYRTKFLSTVALTLTNNCNLSCDYCYANKGLYDVPHKVMSLEIAKKSIDITIESVIKNNGNKIRVCFFGGEPLLEFESIKKLVKYVNDKTPRNIKKEYLITTNGTLINSSVAEFLNVHKFLVTISIDGDKKYHDFFRKDSNGLGSYDSVLSAVHILLPLGLPKLVARVTINENNPNIHEHINHLVSIGFNEITYAYDYNISMSTFDLFVNSLQLLFNNYFEDIRTNNYYSITNITSIFQTLAFNLKTKSHCSAGISYMSVSADGQFYHCPRFTGSKEHSAGKVEDINLDKIAIYNSKVTEGLGAHVGERTPQCMNCQFIYLCGGVCYHHAYSSGNSNFAFVNRECSYRKKLYNLVFELICKLSVNERKSFLEYLNQG